jgi:hypothetical protein
VEGATPLSALDFLLRSSRAVEREVACHGSRGGTRAGRPGPARSPSHCGRARARRRSPRGRAHRHSSGALRRCRGGRHLRAVAGFGRPESVDICGGEIAGFGFASLGRPRPRTGIPAALR